MKRVVFRLKENPQNSSHHSLCFIWCEKAAQVKREWMGGESKPRRDCFSILNVPLMKNLLFSMRIFWREKRTGKTFSTVGCFVCEVLAVLPCRPNGVPPYYPEVFLLFSLGAAEDFPSWFHSPADSSEVFKWTHVKPMWASEINLSLTFVFLSPFKNVCLNFTKSIGKILGKSVWGNPTARIYKDIETNFEKWELKEKNYYFLPSRTN